MSHICQWNIWTNWKARNMCSNSWNCSNNDTEDEVHFFITCTCMCKYGSIKIKEIINSIQKKNSTNYRTVKTTK